jgi:hypothetical protein
MRSLMRELLRDKTISELQTEHRRLTSVPTTTRQPTTTRRREWLVDHIIANRLGDPEERMAPLNLDTSFAFEEAIDSPIGHGEPPNPIGESSPESPDRPVRVSVVHVYGGVCVNFTCLDGGELVAPTAVGSVVTVDLDNLPMGEAGTPTDVEPAGEEELVGVAARVLAAARCIDPETASGEERGRAALRDVDTALSMLLEAMEVYRFHGAIGRRGGRGVVLQQKTYQRMMDTAAWQTNMRLQAVAAEERAAAQNTTPAQRLRDKLHTDLLDLQASMQEKMPELMQFLVRCGFTNEQSEDPSSTGQSAKDLAQLRATAIASVMLFTMSNQCNRFQLMVALMCQSLGQQDTLHMLNKLGFSVSVSTAETTRKAANKYDIREEFQPWEPLTIVIDNKEWKIFRTFITKEAPNEICHTICCSLVAAAPAAAGLDWRGRAELVEALIVELTEAAAGALDGGAGAPASETEYEEEAAAVEAAAVEAPAVEGGDAAYDADAEGEADPEADAARGEQEAHPVEAALSKSEFTTVGDMRFTPAECKLFLEAGERVNRRTIDAVNALGLQELCALLRPGGDPQRLAQMLSEKLATQATPVPVPKSLRRHQLHPNPVFDNAGKYNAMVKYLRILEESCELPTSNDKESVDALERFLDRMLILDGFQEEATRYINDFCSSAEPPEPTYETLKTDVERTDLIFRALTRLTGRGPSEDMRKRWGVEALLKRVAEEVRKEEGLHTDVLRRIQEHRPDTTLQEIKDKSIPVNELKPIVRSITGKQYTSRQTTATSTVFATCIERITAFVKKERAKREEARLAAAVAAASGESTLRIVPVNLEAKVTALEWRFAESRTSFTAAPLDTRDVGEINKLWIPPDELLLAVTALCFFEAVQVAPSDDASATAPDPAFTFQKAAFPFHSLMTAVEALVDGSTREAHTPGPSDQWIRGTPETSAEFGKAALCAYRALLSVRAHGGHTEMERPTLMALKVVDAADADAVAQEVIEAACAEEEENDDTRAAAASSGSPSSYLREEDEEEDEEPGAYEEEEKEAEERLMAALEDAVAGLTSAFWACQRAVNTMVMHAARAYVIPFGDHGVIQHMFKHEANAICRFGPVIQPSTMQGRTVCSLQARSGCYTNAPTAQARREP